MADESKDRFVKYDPIFNSTEIGNTTSERVAKRPCKCVHLRSLSVGSCARSSVTSQSTHVKPISIDRASQMIEDDLSSLKSDQHLLESEHSDQSEAR